MRVAEKYNLIRPKYDRRRALLSDALYKKVYHSEFHEYEKRFRELIEEES